MTTLNLKSSIGDKTVSSSQSATTQPNLERRSNGHSRPPRTERRRSLFSITRMIWLLPLLALLLVIFLAITPTTRWVHSTGYIMTDMEVEIRPSVEGAIKHWLIPDGASVTKDQLLIQLNNDVQRASFQQAQNDLEAKRQQLEQLNLTHNYDRNRKEQQVYQAERSYSLAKEHVELMSENRGFSYREVQDAQLRMEIAASRLVELTISQEEFWAQQIQVLREQIHAAEKAVALREAELQLREIRAPIDGMVYFNRFEPGEFVKTEHVLGQIFDPSLWIAKLKVDERNMAHITLGQPVELSLATYPVLRYGYLQGTITRIIPVVTPQATGDGIFYVEATIQDIPERIRLHPGMTTTCYINAGETTWLMNLIGW